jgi:methionyl-tRNA formyltransferase
MIVARERPGMARKKDDAVKPARLVILGRGEPAIHALEILRQRGRGPAVTTALVLVDAAGRQGPGDLDVYCRDAGLPYLAHPDFNSPQVLDALRRAQPDLAVSISNLQILGPDFLAVPSRGHRGTVNFHNGLLPEYAGLNTTTWAIFQGEARHGVCCHFVEPRLDAGGIIACESFPIQDNDTALDLGLRSMRRGVALFHRLLDGLAADSLKAEPQDLSRRRVYGMNQWPGGGCLDFSWSAPRLERMVRSMDFSPLPGPVGLPFVRSPQGKVQVSRARVVEAKGRWGQPGEVLSVARDGFRVAAGRGVVDLVSAWEPEADRTGDCLAPGVVLWASR